jgi:hypothetical protein
VGIKPNCSESSFDFILEPPGIQYVENGTSSIQPPYEWEYDAGTNSFSIPTFGIRTNVGNSTISDFLSDDWSTMLPATIITTFKSDPRCTGSINTHNCGIILSPIEYEVVADNGSVSLREAHWQNDKLMDL